jgi:hypothetical protein
VNCFFFLWRGGFLLLLVMPTDDELEQHIRNILNLLQRFEEAELQRMANEKRHDADFAALYSIMRELAGQAGISSEKFSQHFQLRQAVFLERLLLRAKKKDAGLAARIDRRSQDEIPTADGYPPLFSPEASR